MAGDQQVAILFTHADAWPGCDEYLDMVADILASLGVPAHRCRLDEDPETGGHFEISEVPAVLFARPGDLGPRWLRYGTAPRSEVEAAIRRHLHLV